MNAREKRLVVFALHFLAANLDDGEYEALTGKRPCEVEENPFEPLVEEIQALAEKVEHEEVAGNV